MSLTVSGFNAVVTVGTALSIAAGAAWFLFEERDQRRDTQARLERVEAELQIFNGQSETDLRLIRLENSDRRTDEILGAMQAEISELRQINAGLNQNLNQRLTQIEDEIASELLTSISNERIDIVQEFAERLSAMEELVADLAVRPTMAMGTGSPTVRIEADFQENLPTMVHDRVEVGLIGCEAEAASASCGFLIKNLTEERRICPQFFGTGDRSAVFPPSGEPVIASRGSIGVIEHRSSVCQDFPREIPIRVDVDFDGIPEDAVGLLAVQLELNIAGSGDHRFEFRDVAISRAR